MIKNCSSEQNSYAKLTSKQEWSFSKTPDIVVPTIYLDQEDIETSLREYHEFNKSGDR